LSHSSLTERAGLDIAVTDAGPGFPREFLRTHSSASACPIPAGPAATATRASASPSSASSRTAEQPWPATSPAAEQPSACTSPRQDALPGRRSHRDNTASRHERSAVDGLLAEQSGQAASAAVAANQAARSAVALTADFAGIE
jgi:hypothetical protein